ncbi:MAG: hypothetical protein WC666_00710 [Candidatus Paceibacterota bacterium]|jgi:hypothetical protein
MEAVTIEDVDVKEQQAGVKNTPTSTETEKEEPLFLTSEMISDYCSVSPFNANPELTMSLGARWQRDRIVRLLAKELKDVNLQISQPVAEKPEGMTLMVSIKGELRGRKDMLEKLIRKLL